MICRKWGNEKPSSTGPSKRHPWAHHSFRIAVKTSLFTSKCTLRVKNETPAKCSGPTSASRGLLYNFISNWRGASVSEGSCLPDSESWSTSASLWVTTQSWARLLRADRQSVWLSNHSKVIYILDLASLVTFQSKPIRSCWKSPTSVRMNWPSINTWGWTAMWQREQTEYLIKEREFESQIRSSMEHSRRTIQHQNKCSWSFQSRYASRIPFNACMRSSSWNEM